MLHYLANGGKVFKVSIYKKDARALIAGRFPPTDDFVIKDVYAGHC